MGSLQYICLLTDFMNICAVFLGNIEDNTRNERICIFIYFISYNKLLLELCARRRRLGRKFIIKETI